jgi:hypothetical protein
MTELWASLEYLSHEEAERFYTDADGWERQDSIEGEARVSVFDVTRDYASARVQILKGTDLLTLTLDNLEGSEEDVVAATLRIGEYASGQV